MVEFKVQREKNDEGGRYFVALPGHQEAAELTWLDIGPSLIAANHTFVPETMRGQGVAEAMVHQLVSDAHNESIRILPLCTYVQAQFARHPEWEDVRKDL